MHLRTVVITSIVLLICLLLYPSWYSYQIYHFAKTPIIKKTEPPVTFILEPGTPVIKLAWQLHDKGLLANPNYFIKLAKIKGDMQKIQAGEYSIEPGMNPLDLLAKLVSGNIVLHKITFVEGWTFKQMVDELNSNPAIKHSITQKTPSEIMQGLNAPYKNPEGLFFPNTYLFKLNTKDTVILKIGYELMQAKLRQAWLQRAPNLPYKNSYEALIAASLIEREAKLADERPLVSGVIMRRLQKNMPLQIDAALLYGLNKNFEQGLTKADMKTANPYNTYKNKGLPPTPIAMPGLLSIEAALHPASGNALYYVAKEDGTGAQVFSDTLQQHDQAIRQYLLPKKIITPLNPAGKTVPVLTTPIKCNSSNTKLTACTNEQKK